MEEKKFVTFKKEELGVKGYIKSELGKGKISSVSIEYTPVGEKIIIATSTPGYVIGRKGEKIDELTAVLKKKFKLDNPHIDIREIENPVLDAQLVAENIALQLEKRVAFRRAMKRSIGNALKFGAKGIKIVCAGRLSGAEIARTEQYKEGRVPLHTLRADIDYGVARAMTTYGIIGVKVIIYKGDTVGKIGSEKFIPADGLHEAKFGKRRPRPAAQV